LDFVVVMQPPQPDTVSYSTYEGPKTSHIVKSVVIKNRTFHQLENGECVAKTKLGYVRIMADEFVMNEFEKAERKRDAK
jgi:hypothetical protein